MSHRTCTTFHLTPRGRQIAELLMQGADNKDIAKELGMAPRTVKAHMNRMFLQLGLTSGVKRVKLAVIIYRDQLYSSASQNGSGRSWTSSPRDTRTANLDAWLDSLRTWSKITSASSTTDSDCGTVLN